MTAPLESGLPDLLGDVAPVYPYLVPEGADLPAISYRRVSTASGQDHDGPSNLSAVRIELTVHADTHLAALDLAETIRDRLAGFAGVVGGVTVENVEFENLFDGGTALNHPSWTVVTDFMFHVTSKGA